MAARSPEQLNCVDAKTTHNDLSISIASDWVGVKHEDSIVNTERASDLVST